MMFSGKITQHAVLVLGFAAIALTAACDNQDTTNGSNSDICKTNVTATSSPTTGALTMTGQFYADETVILRYTDTAKQTHQYTGTPATDRTAFTLTGLPSGDNTYSLIISCAGGQENNGSHLYTVK